VKLTLIFSVKMGCTSQRIQVSKESDAKEEIKVEQVKTQATIKEDVLSRSHGYQLETDNSSLKVSHPK
jgi:hypothetical protein